MRRDFTRYRSAFSTYPTADKLIQQKIAFLGQSRSLGFSIDDCRTLLSLYEDRDRASASVKAVATEHLERITQKVEELQELKSILEDLVTRCNGDDRPDCPILNDLSGHEAKSS